jgi:single-strand DNA-binding protein
MPLSFNQQILLGHVGQDPEVRYTTNGDAVATLSVATSRMQGEEKQTTWHRVVAFKKAAEYIGEHVVKGSFVFVRGETRHEKYTDKQGVERWTTKVIAHEFILCSPGKARADADPGAVAAGKPGTPETEVGSDEELPF